jgi:hypothetical protein
MIWEIKSAGVMVSSSPSRILPHLRCRYLRLRQGDVEVGREMVLWLGARYVLRMAFKSHLGQARDVEKRPAFGIECRQSRSD